MREIIAHNAMELLLVIPTGELGLNQVLTEALGQVCIC